MADSAEERAATLRALTVDLALDGHLAQAEKVAKLAEAIQRDADNEKPK